MPQSTAVRVRRRRFSQAFAATLLGGLAAAARADAIEELRALVESGRADEAYTTYCAVAGPISTPREFDLWCGIAAVDLGRAAEGVLALERYVLQFPDDLRARLELARAYFYAGDNLRAREGLQRGQH